MVNAYITNQFSNTVSVIDTGSNSVIATVNVGQGPSGAAVTPDGLCAYITNFSTDTVSVIDTTTNTVIATVTVGSRPWGVAISPNGARAYIANSQSNSVSVIDIGTNTVIATISLGSGTGAWAIAVSPDGTKVYVTNTVADSVSVIDSATNTVSTTITSGIGTTPASIALTPDGSMAYVGNANSGTVSVIDTATNTTSTTITVGNNPLGIAITPDGNTTYVTNQLSDNVSVIDIATNTVSATVNVGIDPVGVAITPDGTTAYVANIANSVSVIDTATNTVSTTISLPSGSSPVASGQFIQPPSIPMTNVYVPPQGRLTLTSNTPVMTADATAQTSVYYTPYQGNIVPIYDGANMQSYTFGQLTMALNTSNQLSTKLYDLFAFLNSSVVTIGAGPAWSSSTFRGTGSNTTEYQQIDGLWVNANTITLKNGSTSYSSIPVGQATYLGTVYMTANGQTGMAFQPASASLGTNNILGLYNAYNRVTISSRSIDSTTSWPYSTATVRPANGSTSNRISWVDGLQQSFVRAEYQVQAACSSGDASFVYIGLDSTATPQSSVSGEAVSLTASLRTASDIPPQLGFHYVQALENTSGGSGVTFYGGRTMNMKAVLEM